MLIRLRLRHTVFVLYSSLIEFAIRRFSYSILSWSAQRDSCKNLQVGFRELVLSESE